MDLRDSPAQAAFRAEARAWLAANAPAHLLADVSSTHVPSANPEEGKAWMRAKADAGYVGFNVPREYGGRGTNEIEAAIFAQEEARYPLPQSGAIAGQHDILIPVLIDYYPERARSHVPRMLRGDEVWCQLFSEPGAGSDLAGLGTRAVRDGDGWVVNGQKTWNSSGHLADWGFLVARTDPDVPKHKGLTCFVVDMRARGVTLRPIRQANGLAEFNDVFFDDVRIDGANVIGEVNGGWAVVMATLLSERRSLATLPVFTDDILPGLYGLAGEEGGDRWSKLVDWHISGEGSKLFFQRVMTRAARGVTPGPEVALLKLIDGPRLNEIWAATLDWVGEDIVEEDHPLHGLEDEYLLSYGFRIGGGTEDILRNMIAEQVLRLPGDVKVDKSVTFNEARKLR